MVTTRRISAGQKISKGFVYGFAGLLAAVAVLNAQPYIQASVNLFSEVLIIPGVGLISRVPGVAPIVALFGLLLPPLLGVFVWALLQIMQCVPLFMADPEVLIQRINAARAWCQVNLGASDVDWVNDLIERFLSFPKDLQRDLVRAAAISYLVDGAIGIWHYPPLNVPVTSIKQGWDYFMQLLVGEFDFGLVDWGSVGKLAIMLFAFEGMIAIALRIRQVGIYLLGVRHDHSK